MDGHARNLLEFFTRTNGGKDQDNYAFAQAYVPGFVAFQDAKVSSRKNELYRQICAQICHLSFNRAKDGPDKVRIDHEMPEAKRMLEPEIKEFVRQLPDAHKRHWDEGAQKCGLSHWGL
jgi:hypothetical protein